MKTAIVDWAQALSSANVDQSVGIQIATLVETDGKGTYITVIPPGASVNPHYHANGDEEYHIISGKGVIRLLSVEAKLKGGEWTCQNVTSRNSFIIPPNVIHQLMNDGDEPLTLIFSCPISHLKEDRYII